VAFAGSTRISSFLSVFLLLFFLFAVHLQETGSHALPHMRAAAVPAFSGTGQARVARILEETRLISVSLNQNAQGATQ